MNSCFYDPAQSVYVKVLSSVQRADRECLGALYFEPYVGVVMPEHLDARTLRYKKARGTLSVKVPDELLQELMTNMLVKIYENFAGPVIPTFSIRKTIADMAYVFKGNQDIERFLQTYGERLQNVKFIPIHGDLQKQNIYVDDNKLILIDFEHFCFGPLELELVNSLYHNDENCLHVGKIIKSLVEEQMISTDVLTQSLIFYGLKECMQGKKEDFNVNMKKGLKNLEMIMGIVCDVHIPSLAY